MMEESFHTPPSSPSGPRGAPTAADELSEVSLGNIFATPTGPPPPASPAAASTFAAPSRGPILVSANLNGLVSKRAQLQALLAAEGASLACLQETKTCATTDSRLIRLPGFRSHRRDRTANGGGVAVLVSTTLCGRPLSSKTLRPRSATLEAVGAEVSQSKTGLRLILISTYRPPGQSAAVAEQYVEDLGNFIADVSKPGWPLLITGDLNYDLGKPEARALESVLHGQGLSCLNPAEATHGLKRIDWAWSSTPATAPACLLAPLEKGVDGHAVLRISTVFRHLLPAPRPLEDVRLWRSMNGELAADFLDSALFPPLLHEKDPCVGLHALYTALEGARDLAVPLRRLPAFRQEDPPWLSRACIRVSAAANQAHTVYRRLRDSPSALPFAKAAAKSAYQTAYKERIVTIAEAQRSYQKEVLEAAGREGRLWECHDKLAGRSKRGLDVLVDEAGRSLTDPSEIASRLRHSFLGNFQADPRPLLPLSSTPAKVPAEALFSCYEVAKYLERLKEKAACGPDGLPASFLKALSPSIQGPLTIVLNRIMAAQDIPPQWKEAHVTPVPKKPDAATAGDHRPISILAGLSKIFERKLLSLLHSNLKPCDKRQFGFARHSSTSDALASLQIQLVKASSRKPARVAIVSFDISKAFDRIPHSTILKAIRDRGAPEYLCRLVHRWLVGRRWRVKVGKALSSWASATSGCPQGSLTGPTLFSHAIDSVFELPFSEGTWLQLYADDALLIKEVSGPGDEEALAADCNLFASHLASLGLLVNGSKSSVMLSSQAPVAPRLRLPLLVGGCRVPEVDSVRILGVLFDRRFDLNSHWRTVAASAKRALGAIGRLVNYNPVIFRHLLEERVIPLLLFSLAPAAPTTMAAWDKVDGVLRYAAHRLTNNWRLHGQDILALAKLPSARQLADKSLASFLYAAAFKRRRIGDFLEWGQPRVEGLRNTSDGLLPEVRGLLLDPQDIQYVKHKELFPGRAYALWNPAITELGAAFAAKPGLPSLLSHLSLQ